MGSSNHLFAAFLCQALVGLIFVFSSSIKILNGPAKFTDVLRSYDLLPRALERPFAFLVIVTEWTAGLMLLISWGHFASYILAASLLLAFSVGIAINILRGKRDIACGCFGSSKRGLSWGLLVRNLTLIGLIVPSFLFSLHLNSGDSGLLQVSQARPMLILIALGVFIAGLLVAAVRRLTTSQPHMQSGI